MCPSQPHLKIAVIRVEILESKAVSLARIAFSSGQVLLSDLAGRHLIAVFQIKSWNTARVKGRTALLMPGVVWPGRAAERLT
jgi:hypothetical protein